MEAYKEPIHYQNPQLCLKVWEFAYTGESAEPLPWHYHKEIELIAVREGLHVMETPSAVYKLEPGDVWIAGSSQLHRPSIETGQFTRYVVLHADLEPYFDPATLHFYSYFMELNHPLDALNEAIRRKPDIQREIGRILFGIHDEVMEQRKGYELAVSMHMKHLLLTLLRCDDQGILDAFEPGDAAVLRPVLDYVDRQLGEKIDMAEVSGIAGMSYVYFSKYFKRNIGMSFTEYVNRKRIAEAKRQLAIGDKPVTAVALSVGMENMAHFYEMFKRYNDCTPKQFKDRMVNRAKL